MDNKPFQKLTTGTLILFLQMAGLVLWSFSFTYFGIINQVAEQSRQAIDESTKSNTNLIKRIDRADEADDNQTQALLDRQDAKQDRNYKTLLFFINRTNTLINATSDLANKTNNLTGSLSQNFGDQSDYIMRENNYRNMTLRNQIDIMGMLKNITK